MQWHPRSEKMFEHAITMKAVFTENSILKQKILELEQKLRELEARLGIPDLPSVSDQTKPK